MNHTEGVCQGVDGLELYYQCWCPADEPKAALVIVHGLGEHGGRYPNLVNHLVPRGYAIYACDLRGHGRSPGQRGYAGSWTEVREDVRAFVGLVQDREPGRPLFLMGHSLGGLIALEYALHCPEGLQGLIASAPGLSSEGLSAAMVAVSRVLSGLWPRLSLETGLEAAAISRDPAVVEAYINDPLVHSKGTPRMAVEALRAIEWTMAHASDLRLPLLVVHGAADRIVPVEASRSFFERVDCSDKECREYEGCYHELHNDLGWERPVAEVGDWLDRHV
jgi:alpha-beta hydrolase superfamily lysophospholipase